MTHPAIVIPAHPLAADVRGEAALPVPDNYIFLSFKQTQNKEINRNLIIGFSLKSFRLVYIKKKRRTGLFERRVKFSKKARPLDLKDALDIKKFYHIEIFLLKRQLDAYRSI